MGRTKEQLLDEYLVASARTGDRKAFELLARRWQPKLVAHARRLIGDSELARDAAQEGWIEIVRGLGRLRDERAFPAWAYQLVTRRCTRQIGRLQRGRALAVSTASEPVECSVVQPESDLPALVRLRAALADLPREQGAAVALFYLESLSVAETAIALNVPAGTVKTRLMHARRKLRAVLEGETG